MASHHSCNCDNNGLSRNDYHLLMEGLITYVRPNYELLSANLVLAELEGPALPKEFIPRAVAAEMDLDDAKIPLFNPRYFDPTDLRGEWAKVANVLICMQDVQKVYDEAGVAVHPYFAEVRQELEEWKVALEDNFRENAPQTPQP
jgi:hypothetical protein